jgi:acetyl-CoA carboxylase alpha subunit
VGEALARSLEALEGKSPDELVEERYDRFRVLGAFEEKG